ncbi:MAG: primosomal protein N' [Clostridia bacterium]|nr:primosomal protein N' [Clostridia bacterium]
MFCEVYILDAPFSIDRAFDYAVPEGVTLIPGTLVKVPFGAANHRRDAIVTRVKETTDAKETKPVHTVLPDRYSLSEDMLGLCLFLKNYTLCTFGEAVRTVLPPGALSEKANIRYRRSYRLALSEEETKALLPALRSDGQKIVLEYLLPIGNADEELVRRLPGVTAAHLSALVKKGILALTSAETIRNPYGNFDGKRDTSEIRLSTAQTAAFETIESLLLSGEPRAALLYGVTGSGKTKVIMKAIDRTIEEGKRVIMLVPEISLTPQTVGIFCSRYGERVAVIHSMLSQGERLDAYRRIKAGDVDLVIGTRSAVFAPLPDLGMIVIDEEHEHTYKSENDPKYHARDVAAYRAGQSKALMLLASATPSVESFHKAKTGKYTLVPLRERYGGVGLPTAYVVDMREELKQGNTSPVSRRLLESLNLAYEREEQSILFLNRRGFHSQISCKSCGEVLLCPHCSVSLTHHKTKSGAKLLCHLCGYSAPVPKNCPSCGSENLSFLGFGTQKLETDLAAFLPDARILRMDADTTGQKMAYDKMLDDFRKEEYDVMLGTQMVTKGHDFPKVTLVGVLLADASLYVSDFRASERTFSLLTQVIGRAGRAGAGAAVIQTFNPENEIIRLACKQDYDTFYRGEIALRKELSYPPFCDMALLTVTSEDERVLFEETGRLRDLMEQKLVSDYAGIPFQVFGPFEAAIYKANEKYRLRLVVKCKLNADSRKFFRELLCLYAPKKNVTLAVDLNPLTV